jgi:hypothetical protein
MSSRIGDRFEEEVSRSAVTAATAVPTETWVRWPVDWTAVWVGALSGLAAVLVFGLIGTAIGAHMSQPDKPLLDFRTIKIGTLAYSIFSAFLAFVIAGWVTGRVAGIRRSEPAMLHGAISWLVCLPVLVVLAGLGAGSYMGGWYGGVAGSPSWARASTPYERPEALDPGATAEERTRYQEEMATYRERMKNWREGDAAKAARNTALGALTALLLGLMGSVIGGWMASGEPMTFTHTRMRSAAQPVGTTAGRVNV